MNSMAYSASTGSARRPVIGISAHTGPVKVAIFDMRATFVAQIFLDRVAAAGGTPVLLPPLVDTEYLTERLDGLLVLAGPDVDPARYGQSRHPLTRPAEASRDAAELALIDAAIEAELPFFGICRGLQLLNTARGGTLHQHLPDLLHHDRHSPGDGIYAPQQVRLEPGSRLAKAMGETAVVSCHHHQAIDRLGAGLTATAWAADGIVEAVEFADHPFAVAVQWHAEQDPDSGPFLALTEAAREHQRVQHS
ncbi:MAG: gamma-glutamyl-gamma-aminobutyrate hydrolase family protein [Jatrophihabitantaceae bacterium]